ncbi:CU044_2847 family protein [Streptomyces abikoensis]|uniref:CU044_2847 family protein n=1 Tax=Streptomyces abikoensis TaxID=97398 RepID=UPI0033CBAC5B
MAYLVELPLDDGGECGSSAQRVVKVAISERESGLVRVARPGQVVARASRSLREMLDSVRPVADTFVGSFRGLAHAPDEISVEFGISLSAEADVIISSTGAEANFTVSLKWNRQQPAPGAMEPPSPPPAGP